MQNYFAKSSSSPSHARFFQWGISAWILTAVLLSVVPGCGIIADAPDQSTSRGIALPRENQSNNSIDAEKDIPSIESPSAPIAPASPETQQASPFSMPPAPSPSTVVETGLASWYGAKHQGKRTASGEIFDQKKFTAAHRTLPWGSKVKVTNLDNGKSVEVRINDRGPYMQDRIIDLSRAAAKALGMLRSGVAWVRMELISPPESSRDLVLQNRQSSSGNRQ
jgi:peptidoglycan lytic transglycosylase